MRKVLLVIALTFVMTPLALGQVAKATMKEKKARMAKPAMVEMGYYRTADIKWMEAPPGLPAGAKLAVLEGDPGKSGEYTMRGMFPAGYMIAPHYHGGTEHVTVVSGKLFLGMGEKFDKTGGRELGVGDFAFMPKGMRHFAWTEGETVIQLHGVGPWTITYLNPKDDPRNKK
jgi:quercetin dioxygenase-like cupin family protein